MNVPARYCTGYLGDIGVPLDDAPMDFSAWFEAYLGGRWGIPSTLVITSRALAAF
jgi:transglutaminase-like putative cysteine protease